MDNRKYWIDNVRTFCVLLLIPFHAVMIFNDLNEAWYINAKPSMAASMFNFSVYQWWMSGLFVLAGVSAVYALKKRNAREYFKERVNKLLIPFLCGLVFVIPIQNYLADKYHNGYSDNYLQHFQRFCKITDLSGADGCFSPGNLWFILYLFVIAVVSMPILFWYKKKEKKLDGNKLIGWKIVALGIVPPIMEPLLDLGGKSVTEFLGWFLIGYFVMSIDEVQQWIKKYYKVWFVLWVLIIISRCMAYYAVFYSDFFWEPTNTLLRWIGILNLFAIGMKFFNRKYKYTEYLAKASYPICIFHQSFVVVWGYLLVNRIGNAFLAYIAIVIASFISTWVVYEITRRFPLTRFMFGIKK